MSSTVRPTRRNACMAVFYCRFVVSEGGSGLKSRQGNQHQPEGFQDSHLQGSQRKIPRSIWQVATSQRRFDEGGIRSQSSTQLDCEEVVEESTAHYQQNSRYPRDPQKDAVHDAFIPSSVWSSDLPHHVTRREAKHRHVKILPPAAMRPSARWRRSE